MIGFSACVLQGIGNIIFSLPAHERCPGSKDKGGYRDGKGCIPHRRIPRNAPFEYDYGRLANQVIPGVAMKIKALRVHHVWESTTQKYIDSLTECSSTLCRRKQLSCIYAATRRTDPYQRFYGWMFNRQAQNVGQSVMRGEMIHPTRYIIFAERMEGCVSADESRVGTLSRNEMREIFVTNR